MDSVVIIQPGVTCMGTAIMWMKPCIVMPARRLRVWYTCPCQSLKRNGNHELNVLSIFRGVVLTGGKNCNEVSVRYVRWPEPSVLCP